MSNLTLTSLIQSLEGYVKNPEIGLPDEIFYLVGRLTPYVNIDLLIKIPNLGSVLTWRDDPHTGSGWHIPGGIVRFRENIQERVRKVANLELGVELESISGPIEVNQIISKQKERSHFISLLFSASLDDKNKKIILKKIKENPREINIFTSSPKNLIRWHKIYDDKIRI
jgi:ADP-ribose pyrophosphatase YjhB (NUDIX family)